MAEILLNVDDTVAFDPTDPDPSRYWGATDSVVFAESVVFDVLPDRITQTESLSFSDSAAGSLSPPWNKFQSGSDNLTFSESFRLTPFQESRTDTVNFTELARTNHYRATISDSWTLNEVARSATITVETLDTWSFTESNRQNITNIAIIDSLSITELGHQHLVKLSAFDSVTISDVLGADLELNKEDLRAADSVEILEVGGFFRELEALLDELALAESWDVYKAHQRITTLEAFTLGEATAAEAGVLAKESFAFVEAVCVCHDGNYYGVDSLSVLDFARLLFANKANNNGPTLTNLGGFSYSAAYTRIILDRIQISESVTALHNLEEVAEESCCS